MRFFCLVTVVILCLTVSSLAAVPQALNYQGYLTDTVGSPVTATVAMTFTLYDSATDGIAQWTETQPTVAVNNGIYAVALGALNPIDPTIINGDLWLGVKVGADAEMIPRQKLNSVAFAMQSALAVDLVGNLAQSRVTDLVATLTDLQTQIDQINAPKVQFSDPFMDRISTDGQGPNACDTFDLNGDSLSFSWAITSEPVGSNASFSGADTCAPSFNSDLGGEYVLRVTVDDGNMSVAQSYTYKVVPNYPVNTLGSLPDFDSMDAVEDGSGGVILAWEDNRSGAGTSLYAQRLDADGNSLWDANGKAILNVADGQDSPVIASDGIGGAIFAWSDQRSGLGPNIYVQRIDGNGTPLWSVNDIALTSTDSSSSPKIIKDGSGGVIVIWAEGILKAQRVDADGNFLWAAGGVAVTTTPGEFDLVPDGSGGALIAYHDGALKVQKLDASGNPLWSTSGIQVSASGDFNLDPRYSKQLVSDGVGGLIITWESNHLGDKNIYAQRIDAAGALLWGSEGVAVSESAFNQIMPAIVSDGSGGVVIAWGDYRNADGYGDIYAQRLDASGGTKWTANGKVIVSAAFSQYRPKFFTNSAGEIVLLWPDKRFGASNQGTDVDLFAQKIDLLGNPIWQTQDVPFTTARNEQSSPLVVSDGAGGFFAIWADGRFTGSSPRDIFAQRILSDGGYVY